MCVVRIGLREIFFLTHTFCALPHGAVCFCVSPLSYLRMYHTIVLFTTYVPYNFLIVYVEVRCVHTSDHLPSHHLEASNFKPPSTTPPTIEFTSPVTSSGSTYEFNDGMNSY